MSTPFHGGYRPAKLEPTPRYPHIILALNIVSITPPRFHWLIFVPAPGQDEDEVEVEVGTKVHAIRLFRRAFGSPNPAEIWRFEATTFTLSTSASGSVVAAAIIGQLKHKTEQQLVDLLEEIPMDVPAVDRDREDVFSCRVWVREALRRLHGAGFIHCPDVDAMENEMVQYGEPVAREVKNQTFRLARLVVARNSRTL